MDNFEFCNPVRIIFGKDRIRDLNEYIPSGVKVMIIYGGGSIFRNGVYEKVKNALKGVNTCEFGGVEPNPCHETCMRAVTQIRDSGVDFLLAVGGGSVIDATKYIAAAVYFKGDPWQILSRNASINKTMPFGSVLTLPATGTEMNANSVISKQSSGEKLAFSDPKVMPQFSILDPTTSASLPQKQVANGIVDAFVHVIEQYLTYPNHAPLQDRMAEAILKTLIEEGPKVYKNPADYDAMANLMWCSTMALNGLISRGVPEDWMIHMIGHELTAFHGIDHARTLAVVLPGVWWVFREEKGEKLEQYATRVWNIHDGSPAEKVVRAIERTTEFFESLNIATKLSNYNIGIDTVEKIVQRFKKRRWTAIGDREMGTPEKVREILEHQLK
jgi:NADP-dependent alcohol dehydrogenase